jgi:acyl-homoserine lactone acylase PvdQ
VANGINATNRTGRLSEIFGKCFKERYVFAILFEEASEKAIADLDKNSESYKLTMGYLDGINQYMEEGLPHRISVGRCEEREIHHKRCL